MTSFQKKQANFVLLYKFEFQKDVYRRVWSVYQIEIDPIQSMEINAYL